MKKLAIILLMSLSLFGLDFTKNDVIKVDSVTDIGGDHLEKFADALAKVNKSNKERLRSLEDIAKSLSSQYNVVIDSAHTMVKQWIDESALSQERKDELLDSELGTLKKLREMHNPKHSYIIVLSALMKDCVSYASNQLDSCMNNMVDTYIADDSYEEWLNDEFVPDYLYEVKNVLLRYIDELKLEIRSRS